MQERHRAASFEREVKKRMEIMANAGNFTLKTFGKKEKYSPYLSYPWQSAMDNGRLNHPMLRVHEAYIQLRIAREPLLAQLFPKRASKIPKDSDERERYIKRLKEEIDTIKNEHSLNNE